MTITKAILTVKYIMGKMLHQSYISSDECAKCPLELVHCNLAGAIDPAAKDSFKYVLLLWTTTPE